jgi:hypothetical protein
LIDYLLEGREIRAFTGAAALERRLRRPKLMYQPPENFFGAEFVIDMFFEKVHIL